ncbi:MAG: hypothetical protein OET90_11890 [Desulfuromonadales bacterium]|nr:hypothetical protein [Desulfuromonadales bacterium]
MFHQHNASRQQDCFRTIFILPKDVICHQTQIHHVSGGAWATGPHVCVTVADKGRKATEALHCRGGNAPTVVDVGIFALVLMPR